MPSSNSADAAAGRLTRSPIAASSWADTPPVAWVTVWIDTMSGSWQVALSQASHRCRYWIASSSVSISTPSGSHSNTTVAVLDTGCTTTPKVMLPLRCSTIRHVGQQAR